MRELQFKQHLASNSISLPLSIFSFFISSSHFGKSHHRIAIQIGLNPVGGFWHLISKFSETQRGKKNSTRWIRWRDWPQRMELWFSAKALAACAMLSIFCFRKLVWSLMFMRLIKTLKGGKWRRLSWGWDVTRRLCQRCSLAAHWWGPPTKSCPST